ncbi:RNA polymerase sigma-70 factor (ECF subfamily) [Herbihabitans rhizosphaerae]|uniref:RNA polymerase sigma-70 factor (ECF subfamily) n=1 Tax=Herbihabitans rhizosphaerae TaxID=1872711 RepID=A0A4Q7L5L9_9PSEU|nr:sigma-70 family RNA polymerase sigma factor [Herbihabitans rhizosphaerae]RZS44939.1 RNA polymerase sigma-70 factor (ECF subfamily) [Herbihabitans rhizosphaerae]
MTETDQAMRQPLTRARAGDGDAFAELTEPYRGELRLHCYRMLGSIHDAEDALQDTLLSAWQGLGGFEGRSSIRTWLYRVATNRCLNMLRSTSRRPAKEWDMSGADLPEPTRLGEVTWLEPYPDALLEGLAATPEARYEQTEAVSLAFITALQLLPARQRAVLVLREVLGFHATEVADMLEVTVDSVTSALKRARATLKRHRPRVDDGAPTLDSATERARVDQFVRAYTSGDVDALVALLTEDVRLSMPPLPLEYEGTDAVGRFFRAVVDNRPGDFVATRANGQPAVGIYRCRPSGGPPHGTSLFVLTLTGDRISGITRFDTSAFAWFGFPRSLPERTDSQTST